MHSDDTNSNSGDNPQQERRSMWLNLLGNSLRPAAKHELFHVQCRASSSRWVALTPSRFRVQVAEEFLLWISQESRSSLPNFARNSTTFPSFTALAAVVALDALAAVTVLVTLAVLVALAALKLGDKCVEIPTDISRAFDTVDHKIDLKNSKMWRQDQVLGFFCLCWAIVCWLS